MNLAHVRELFVYPVKDEPGRRLEAAQVEAEGLAGDRRKKRPVHVVGSEHTPESVRANVFLDVPDAQVVELLGRHVQVGGARLHLSEVPKNCPGLYAFVDEPGPVAPGDAVEG